MNQESPVRSRKKKRRKHRSRNRNRSKNLDESEIPDWIKAEMKESAAAEVSYEMKPEKKKSTGSRSLTGKIFLISRFFFNSPGMHHNSWEIGSAIIPDV